MEILPSINASLNTLSFVLLVLGYRAVRRGEVEKHKKFMLSALGSSSLFLISYLTYHYTVGHTTFQTEGWPRVIYLSILATHIPLAALMVLPILVLTRLGLKGEIDRHKKWARIVLPIWLYVSITGVAIYFMLYWIWPQS